MGDADSESLLPGVELKNSEQQGTSVSSKHHAETTGDTDKSDSEAETVVLAGLSPDPLDSAPKKIKMEELEPRTSLKRKRGSDDPISPPPSPSVSPNRDGVRKGSGHSRKSSGGDESEGKTSLVNGKRKRPIPLGLERRNRCSDDHQGFDSDDSSSVQSHKPAQRSGKTSPLPTPGLRVSQKKNRDRSGRTLLARACTQTIEDAERWISERPQDINVPDNAGNTPLQIASLAGHADIVGALIQARCDLYCKNIDLDTPLIDAVENGHLDVVKLLLDAGIDPGQRNAKGQEPLELVDSEEEEIKAALLDARRKTKLRRRHSEDQRGSNTPGMSPIDAHMRSPPPPGGRKGRSVRSQHTKDALLWVNPTPRRLQEEASRGNMEMVDHILKMRPEADPLSVLAAVKGGHADVLGLMIALASPDADPEPVHSSSEHPMGYSTPMLAAIGRGNLDIIQMLLEQADFNPTRRMHKDMTYSEISRHRRGPNWEQESDMLQRAASRYHKKKRVKIGSPALDSSPPIESKRGRRRTSQTDDEIAETSPIAKPRRKLVSGNDYRQSLSEAVSQNPLIVHPDPALKSEDGHNSREAHDPSTPEAPNGYGHTPRPDCSGDGTSQKIETWHADSIVVDKKDLIDDAWRETSVRKQSGQMAAPVAFMGSMSTGEEPQEIPEPGLAQTESDPDVKTTNSQDVLVRKSEDSRLQEARQEKQLHLQRQKQAENRQLKEAEEQQRQREQQERQQQEEKQRSKELAKRQQQQQREAEAKRQREAEEASQRREAAAQAEKLRVEAAELLPNGLRHFVLLDHQEAKAKDEVLKWLPLRVMKTEALQSCMSEAEWSSLKGAEPTELWVANIQAAPILASQDLTLSSFSFRTCLTTNEMGKMCLWRQLRNALSVIDLDSPLLDWATVVSADAETRPKFFALDIFWIRLGEMLEAVRHCQHLQGIKLAQRRLAVMPLSK